MFSSVVLEGTDIQSSWKSERSMNDSECQTGDIETKESESQAIERVSAEIQTFNPADQELRLASYDEKSLSAFLNRITPSLLKELDKNLRSHAFEGYDLINDDSIELITKVHTLHTELPKMFGCTGVSWNSMGTVVAVSYGVRNHENWCDHQGRICVWGLQRKDFVSNVPTKKFDNSSCITCLKFHPQQPALLAAGNFIGQILLLDFSGDADFLVCNTETGEEGHHDTITNVVWVETENSKYQLASCGLDGKILIWKQNTQTSQLTLFKAFVILTGNLPRALRLRSNRHTSEVGLTSISFNMEDKALCIIGSEGGGVFQCSTDSQLPASADFKFVMDLINPVALWYNQHNGHVTDVASSPFSRNIFITCGVDGEIRVYNYNQANKPIRTIQTNHFPLKVSWSPAKALLIAAVTSEGYLNLYDLRSSAEMSIVCEKLAEKSSDGCALEFCTQNPKFLATGNEDGFVQIWSLSEKLVLPAPHENDILHTMGRVV